MIKVIKRHARVMAIYPNTRGFGYAVFEGPEVLVDWGTKAARRERRDYGQRKMKQLITFFLPGRACFAGLLKSIVAEISWSDTID